MDKVKLLSERESELIIGGGLSEGAEWILNRVGEILGEMANNIESNDYYWRSFAH